MIENLELQITGLLRIYSQIQAAYGPIIMTEHMCAVTKVP